MQAYRTFDVADLRQRFSYDARSGVVTINATGKAAGTLFSTGHLQVSFRGKIVGVHRIAWALHHGEFPRHQIDHINGDGADNRLCNLRQATSSQNNRNRRISSRNKSGVKGVFWVTKAKVWRVAIGKNRKYQIMHFKNFDEAVSASIALRAKLHAEFANDGYTPMVSA